MRPQFSCPISTDMSEFQICNAQVIHKILKPCYLILYLQGGDPLHQSLSKMFTVFDESNFDANKILRKDSVPSLEKAFKNRFFLSKRERLKNLTLGTTFEKTGRSVLFHYLR